MMTTPTPPVSVLIVDDNARIRSTIRSVLGDWTADVTECANGRDALALYQQLRPDWVFMDISMPELDGITATRRILATDPDARVVIVTDYDDSALRATAKAAGARAYVTKEDLSRLMEVVR